jgi:magnesium chelatase family protein
MTHPRKSLLILGPPGCGKTMSARALRDTIATPANVETDLAWIYWASGLERCAGVPFRAPHHTVSEKGLVGSLGAKTPGSSLRRLYVGEASLAHGGVLFLGELSEFRRPAIESLAHVLRVGYSQLGPTQVPARPNMVVCASNLCPCGYTGSSRPCTCSPVSIRMHTERVQAFFALLSK